MSSFNLSPIGSNGLSAMQNLSLQSAQIQGEPSAAWYYATLGASPDMLRFNTQVTPNQQIIQQPAAQPAVTANQVSQPAPVNYNWIWRYAISTVLVVAGGILLYVGYNNYSKSHKYYKPKS